MLNLKHLYYYHVFTQELSTTCAAKRLYISVPALSNQLTQLEGFLGFKLTKRVKGKVILTENGKIVSHYAERMFSAYEDLKSRILIDANPETYFRVGIGQNLGVRFSFDLLSLVVDIRLEEAHKAFITFDSADKLLTGFKDHKYDLVLGAIVEDPKEANGWVSKSLDFPVRLFVSKTLASTLEPDSKKAEKLDADSMIQLANKMKIPIVIPSENSVLRKETEHFFLNLKELPEKTIECNNSNAIVQLIEDGFAMGFVPTPSLLDFKSARGLKILGPPGGYWTHEISVLAHKGEGKLLTNISPLSEIFMPEAILS